MNPQVSKCPWDFVCYNLLPTPVWFLLIDSTTTALSKVSSIYFPCSEWFQPWSSFLTFSSVQLLSHVQLFVTPWSTGRQASLSITNSRSLLKLISIESVMPSNHLILCHPLLLLPSIFPSIRDFQHPINQNNDTLPLYVTESHDLK